MRRRRRRVSCESRHSWQTKCALDHHLGHLFHFLRKLLQPVEEVEVALHAAAAAIAVTQLFLVAAAAAFFTLGVVVAAAVTVIIARKLDNNADPQKYDTGAFDLPCKPGFKVPDAYFWDNRDKNVPSKACYLSLNFVNDPIYAFHKQFPKTRNDKPCASPVQCLDSGSSGRRRLLVSSSGGSSGNGVSSSDMRLKKNIVPTGRLVAGLLAEYTWEWNDVAKALHLDNQRTVGVMAQEAQALFPEAVSTAADGYMRVDYGMLV